MSRKRAPLSTAEVSVSRIPQMIDSPFNDLSQGLVELGPASQSSDKFNVQGTDISHVPPCGTIEVEILGCVAAPMCSELFT